MNDNAFFANIDRIWIQMITNMLQYSFALASTCLFANVNGIIVIPYERRCTKPLFYIIRKCAYYTS